MNLLIKNGNIVSVGEDKSGVHKADILIEDSKIKKIGKLSSKDIAKKKISKTIDAAGKYVIPGFIQTHIHLCQTLFRGQAEDMELLDWLEKKIWPLEASLTQKSIAKSTIIGLKELIASGTTTIVDMGTAHHTEVIFEVAKRLGIRAFIGNAMMDCGNKLPIKLREKTSDIIKKSLKLIEKYNGQENGRLNYILSPRFILSCSDDLFKEVRELSQTNNLLIQTHAMENPKETKAVVELKGNNEINYFQDIGILNDKLILAHCVWCDYGDIQLLSKTGVNVAHCPTTNLKLGSGIAKIPEMLEQGINVSIGSDGAPANNNLNMFHEMKIAGLIQKYRKGVHALSAKKIFEMATLGGAKTIHKENELGSIEEGKKADLAILDLNKPNTLPEIDDIYTRIVYSADSINVDCVMIDGKIIFSNKPTLF